MPTGFNWTLVWYVNIVLRDHERHICFCGAISGVMQQRSFRVIDSPFCHRVPSFSSCFVRIILTPPSLNNPTLLSLLCEVSQITFTCTSRSAFSTIRSQLIRSSRLEREVICRLTLRKTVFTLRADLQSGFRIESHTSPIPDSDSSAFSLDKRDLPISIRFEMAERFCCCTLTSAFDLAQSR